MPVSSTRGSASASITRREPYSPTGTVRASHRQPCTVAARARTELRTGRAVVSETCRPATTEGRLAGFSGRRRRRYRAQSNPQYPHDLPRNDDRRAGRKPNRLRLDGDARETQGPRTPTLVALRTLKKNAESVRIGVLCPERAYTAAAPRFRLRPGAQLHGDLHLRTAQKSQFDTYPQTDAVDRSRRRWEL